MSSGGSGSSNTVTSIQQIPEFEQQASQQNQELAQSIASQPYPVYQGNLIQQMDPLQTQGQSQAVTAADAYQPYQTAATGGTLNALNSGQDVYNLVNQSAGQIGQGLDASGMNAYSQAASNATGQAQNLTNPYSVGAYMNPYVQESLAPQINQLGLQLAQQQRGIDTTATQANAFGDARQGAAQALQNYYGNQALNELIGTGYNNAYTQAQNAVGQAMQGNLSAASQYGNLAGLQNTQQGIQLTGASQLGNLANTLGSEQQTQLSGSNQLGQLGSQAQSLGLSGANAIYNAGQQNQTQGQNELNAAYQQYINQINWPTQMLNVRESALSNSPYNIATAVTLPSSSSTAQGLGTVSSLAGLAGLLSGSSGGSGSNAPFGGQAIQGSK